MKIIIVGDGKVGFTLAEHLSREEHDVTIIDTSDNALQKASDTLDVMCIKGNGASLTALKEAWAARAARRYPVSPQLNYGEKRTGPDSRDGAFLI